MCRHKHAVIVVVCLLSLSVAGVAAGQTTNWSIDKSSETFRFEPGDGDTRQDTIEVTNNDANNSVSISASIDGGHSVVSTPGQLGPGESGDIVVELDSNGDTSATMDVSGGGKTETVDYTVQTPAYVEVSGIPDWLDDEGVLQGESRTAEITLEEVGGYRSISGISVSGDTNGLDTSEIESASVAAGSSTTVDVTFTADSGASQNEDIGGTLSLDPNDGYNEDTSADLESAVAYPAQFGTVELDSSNFVFDEPRSSGTISKEMTVEVRNSGDRELDFGSFQADSSQLDIETVSEPSTIGPRSTEDVDILVSADTSLSTGEYNIDGTASASDSGVSDGDLDEAIVISHDTELTVSNSNPSVGDIPIGESGSTGMSISESLGYKPITGVEMELVDGQADWIEVTDSPSSAISAGNSSSVGYEIQFPPAADIGTEYTWTFEVTGDSVGTEEITVRSTPIPLNLDPIRTDLESSSAGSEALEKTSQDTLVMVNEVDTRIRNDEIPREDVTTTLTFSNAVIRFIDAVETANTRIENDEYDNAQAALIRAAVAFDTMTTYSEALEDDEIRSQSQAIRQTAEPELEGPIGEQESHYQEQLDSDTISPIREAAIKRQLSRVAALQGDTERSEQLATEADQAFTEYSNLVADGEQERRNAIQTWESMNDDVFVTVVGQQLVLNPFNYDTFESQSDTLLTQYDASESAFREAGETDRAETVAQERAQRSGAVTTARLSLFGSIVVTVILLVYLTIHTARGMYWYVQDSEESISGDFLV